MKDFKVGKGEDFLYPGVLSGGGDLFIQTKNGLAMEYLVGLETLGPKENEFIASLKF